MIQKIVAAIVLLVVVLVGGYFVDDGYKAKVDSAFGRKATVVATTKADPVARATEKSADALDAIVSSGVVRVSVQNPAKPFYTSDGGRPKGFNLDFLKAMFAQSEFNGARISIEPQEVSTYAEVPEQLLKKSGRGYKADLAIDGLTFVDSDLPGVVYSVPYISDFGYSMIVPRGSRIRSIEDTVGKTVGIINGDPDVAAYVKQNFKGARVVNVSEEVAANGKWMTQHFDTGTVDAIVYDYPFAVAEIEDTDLQFAMTKLPGSNIEYKIGVRQEDAYLLEAVNSAIRKVVDTPEYSAMLRKYFMSNKVVSAQAATATEKTYTVQRGDTLGSIAQSELGDTKLYGLIQTRNNLANPNFIAVGQKLVIPKK